MPHGFLTAAHVRCSTADYQHRSHYTDPSRNDLNFGRDTTWPKYGNMVAAKLEPVSIYRCYSEHSTRRGMAAKICNRAIGSGKRCNKLKGKYVRRSSHNGWAWYGSARWHILKCERHCFKMGMRAAGVLQSQNHSRKRPRTCNKFGYHAQ